MGKITEFKSLIFYLRWWQRFPKCLLFLQLNAIQVLLSGVPENIYGKTLIGVQKAAGSNPTAGVTPKTKALCTLLQCYWAAKSVWIRFPHVHVSTGGGGGMWFPLWHHKTRTNLSTSPGDSVDSASWLHLLINQHTYNWQDGTLACQVLNKVN